MVTSIPIRLYVNTLYAKARPLAKCYMLLFRLASLEMVNRAVVQIVLRHIGDPMLSVLSKPLDA